MEGCRKKSFLTKSDIKKDNTMHLGGGLKNFPFSSNLLLVGSFLTYASILHPIGKIVGFLPFDF